MKTFRLIVFLAATLFSSISYAQTNETVILTANSLKLKSGNEEISKVKTSLSELSKRKILIYQNLDINDPHKHYYKGTINNIMVLEDRIEFSVKGESLILNFSDLIDIKFFTTVTQVYFGIFYLEFKDKSISEKFTNNLILIQHQLREERNSELNSFESIASQYRALETKPPVSEEQRKYIVQANSFNEKKDYNKAIELYNKAIELDQSVYPAAYSNLALLSAQVEKFDAAIYYMKKYLLLKPDASDARTAQDKIYEWEANVVK